jgi:predicted esterase
MGSLISKLSKQLISFDFYDSPISYQRNESDDPSVDASSYKQWWNATRDNVLTNPEYDTATESVSNLLKKWESAEYDGILGFSQGSVLTQIFTYQIQMKIIKTYNPKFVILSSTFPITDVKLKSYYETLLDVPTLVMYGSRDTFVTKEQTIETSKYFKNATLLEHSGGHYVSSNQFAIEGVRNFLQPFTI